VRAEIEQMDTADGADGTLTLVSEPAVDGIGPDPTGRVRLRGWGRATGSYARYLPGPPTAGAVTTAGARGVIARGGGRSYGDAATNAGGVVLDTTRGAAIRRLDTERGVVVADAGVRLRDLLAACLPAGWVPPVLPGTGHATVGGALAADVHGKNHVACGSFGRHVVGLTLLTAAGEILELGPGDDRFWATVGGMGLTGVIQRVQLRLRPAAPLSSARLRAADLDGVLAALDRAVAEPAGAGVHAVAWLDGWARGAALGRGLVEVSRPIVGGLDVPSVPARTARSRITRRAVSLGAGMAAVLPGGGIAASSLTRLANQARWRMSGGDRDAGTRPTAEVLFPLDAADVWPAAFGRDGLVQYQFAVPDAGAGLLAVALDRLQRAGIPPGLAVLKRFGRSLESAPLSFPLPGWTLALDLPAAAAGLGSLLDRLDGDVATAGGRVYLAKDARLRPEVLAAMYPGLARWREVRDAMDPGGRFRSDLARRLGLVGHPDTTDEGTPHA